MSNSRRRILQYGICAGAHLLGAPSALGRRHALPRVAQDEPLAQPLVLPPWSHGSASSAPESLLMFRGNATHTHYGTGPLPRAPRVHWSLRMEDFATTLRGAPITWAGTGWTGQAARLGDYVFIGSVGRTLYALEARTGKVVWRHHGQRMFKSSVCVYQNLLYIGNTDDYLRCIDAATGALRWSLFTGNDEDSSPCVVDGQLYICGEAGYAWCLDPQSGAVRWRSRLGGTGRGTLAGSNGAETSPAVDRGELYAGTYDGVLHCLDTRDGAVKWRARTGGDTDVSPVLSDDLVYVAAEEDAPFLYAFARDGGAERWRFGNRLGFWSTPALRGERLWVGGQDGALTCLDARSGAVRWTFQTPRPIWSSPAVVEDRVVFGGYDGNLYILEAETGKEVWRHALGGRCISTPCVVGGCIYIGDAAGTFYCFGP